MIIPVLGAGVASGFTGDFRLRMWQPGLSQPGSIRPISRHIRTVARRFAVCGGRGNSEVSSDSEDAEDAPVEDAPAGSR
jgi:hypothetical protein